LAVTIKLLLSKSKSPAKLAGLFCILLLSSCQTGKSPEDVTASFWQALAQGQIDNARKHVTQDSQHLVNLQDIDTHSTIKTGVAVIEDTTARIETTINRNKRQVTFDTVLLKEQDAWKVDYLQTQMNISLIPFGEVAKSLQNLGDTFAKQLEQQLPQIQKEMESLGNQLKNEIDELGRNLKQPTTPKIPSKPNNPKTPPGTI
jgi:hypothetical protein